METPMLRNKILTGAIALGLVLMAVPATAKTSHDDCEGDTGLDLQTITATMERVEGVKTWTFDIETCLPFTPEDLRSPGDDGAYSISLHIDTVDPEQGRFERTVEVYFCVTDPDQVCADMWAGHSSDRYYGGPRELENPTASQTSATTVRVVFPNRLLGKQARDRSGFHWTCRTAWEPKPGVVSYDYAPQKQEHP